MELVIPIILTLVTTATPLVFVAVGELVTERAGVLNLGVEGMMILGAVAAFITAATTGNTTLAVLVGGMAGLLSASLFALLVLLLRTDQVPTGLALTLLGLGLSALLGRGFIGTALEHQHRGIPGLVDIPVLGPIIFGHDALAYLSMLVAAFTGWWLTRTRIGLVVRAVGEDHVAAHALGYPVLLVRCACVLYGGFLAGLGGAYLSVFFTPLWAENMTGGRGWIALALVVFATWRVGRCLTGAYLFGALSVLQLFQQGKWLNIQSQYLAMLPYLMTIVVLVVISSRRYSKQLAAPGCLGRPFVRD